MKSGGGKFRADLAIPQSLGLKLLILTYCLYGVASILKDASWCIMVSGVAAITPIFQAGYRREGTSKEHRPTVITLLMNLSRSTNQQFLIIYHVPSICEESSEM